MTVPEIKSLNIKGKRFKLKALVGIVVVFLISLLYLLYNIFFYDDVKNTYIPILDLKSGVNQEIKELLFTYHYSICTTAKGELLLKNSKHETAKIFFYLNYVDVNGQEHEAIIPNYKVVKINTNKFEASCNGDVFTASIKFELEEENKSTRFSIETKFLSGIELSRASIVLQPKIEITALTKKNRTIEHTITENEYWLGKNGLLQLGKGDESLLVYGCNLSSVQIKPEGKEIWLNLDYHADHPNIHIINKGEGKWKDVSRNRYNEDDILQSDFFIFTKVDINTYPRLTNHPNGYLSTLIFTEHADNTIIETHRAVYFGSDKIREAGAAKGGFIKHRIPVTKSVFYSNIEKLDNLGFNADNENVQLSINDSKEFEEFLKEIYKEGNEIALHTIDPSADNRMYIDSALNYMQKTFSSVTWIDHAMSDGYSNRESFVADGLDTSSNNYMAEYWNEYGIKYFWNSAIEKEKDCGALKTKLKSFKITEFLRCYLERIFGNNNLLRISDGEHVPAPIYWQNKHIFNSFYSWGTLRHSGYFPGWIWNFVYSEKNLNKFVNERGINIVHFYPAFVGNKLGYSNGIVEYDGRNWEINKNFDKMLARLSEYKTRQEINISTLREYLDYRLALERIEIIPTAANAFKIINKNDAVIKDISFAVGIDREIKTEKQFNVRLVGNDKIFWFDMEAGEEVSLKIDKSN